MFNRPADWPTDDVIDLNIHDLPHASSTTEWWYFNSHLETSEGQKLSLFASFFRRVMGKDEQSGEPRYTHSVVWALVDADNDRYLAESLIDPDAPQIILDILDKKEQGETLIERAMREVLNKGHVTRPDRLIEGPVNVSLDRLNLDFGSTCVEKERDGSYSLALFSEEQQVGIELRFQPLKPPIRHGEGGVVRGVSNEGMFYYFIPRCRVEGSVIFEQKSVPVKTGQGWYDHEFGQHQREGDTSEDANDNIAWNWLSAQLDNGWEVSAYELWNTVRNHSAGHWAIVIDPAGQRHQYTDFTFEPGESWTSIRTFSEYPLRWRLDIPEAAIHLDVEAAFANQEFMTVISKPAFWEGRVAISGTVNGLSTQGLGFVERSGFDNIEEIDQFFAAVGKQVRCSVEKLLPLDPTDEQLTRLIGSPRHAHYLDGIDREQYLRTVIRPLREITDRGGKSWRSYAFVACCDVVGGDSTRIAEWLALPEMLHVGSLIVDDVQDKSLIRRGGPAIHLTYGEPLAINAGTDAYFIAQIFMNNGDLTAEEKLLIYDLYFETMRATHAGQAFDIDGLLDLLTEGGAGESLEARVFATHRLKSAVPARALAMIGAILGNGTPEQIVGLGNFFEAVGLAFQIMDDALNLRGFKNDLKNRGEDLMHGKVTMPVAKAMARLPQHERCQLRDILLAKSEDRSVIESAITLIEKCGALSACEDQASELIESAWRTLDPLIEDSHSKLMIRAFGWYVLERYY